MGACYYDPQLGRFTQPDPSGQETNPYLYAAGDFINNADLTGLAWSSKIANFAKTKEPHGKTQITRSRTRRAI
ncbi:RHS repeat-associated core domain-containing protein [Streptomyces lincolnensis]|uniref:RHS repeat-associated core domain-containing protein n=1 Tax=Streptomyces lincolnensis TaxID=1915 RepID=UPI000A639B12|nr:RHS repeat-associated core domain-containing protein [Streptomyces lincolnensis]